MSARERNVAELAATRCAAGWSSAAAPRRPRAEAAAATSRTTVRELVDEEAALLAERDRAEIAARIVRDSVGLGPLEVLLADPAVEEVMVNGPDRVFVERGGRIEADRGRLRRRGGAAQRDRADPGAARPPRRRAQPDGRRPPRRRLAGQRRDPAAGDRRPGGLDPALRRRAGPAPSELVELGTLSAGAARSCWRRRCGRRRSILVSGGTGSGKTTLLNALSSFIGPDERVVTIEDAAELRLQQPHVVRLESRPAGVEGRGEVTIRDLLRNALRMRPDRIVIGEVRGPEALDLLTALNTGHDGALSTVHANSPARRARPARDAGADGRGRAAARGDRRAGPARDRPRRPPRAPARRRPARDRDRRGGRAAGTTAVRTVDASTGKR